MEVMTALAKSHVQHAQAARQHEIIRACVVSLGKAKLRGKPTVIGMERHSFESA